MTAPVWNPYDLPTCVNIGGKEYTIRYGWRAILDILMAFNDPELDDASRQQVMLEIFYLKYDEIPNEYIPDAVKKACDFIDCGQKDDGKSRPKMIDWEQDASIIIPEINKVSKQEVRLHPDIHWWTFFGWFMGIGEGLLASILHIRQKKAKHKKMEKWEQEFYKENRVLIDLRSVDSDEVRAEKESILKYL